MDIAYHYFAVKTLAVLAGFGNAEAQIIAESSQMVDDFDYYAYWHCTNIPPYIKSSNEYDLLGSFLGVQVFNPATTGFLSGDRFIDKADYVSLVETRFQKFTCTPFHFMYEEADQIGKKEYRVTPATVGNDSIISDLMIDARYSLLTAAEGSVERRWALARVGMLLHIFADTYAHQMFSGYNANANLVELVNVVNNITGADETEKYKSFIQKFLGALKEWVPLITPAIGHMMIEHIPDLTHLSFTMSYKDNHGVQRNYGRSNTTEFIIASRQILNYLLSCRGASEVTADEWARYSTNLAQAFLVDISDLSKEADIVARLRDVWYASFRLLYDYDSKMIKKSHVLEATEMDAQYIAEHNLPDSEANFNTKASDDFYMYNVLADRILIQLYGPKPRHNDKDDTI